MISKYKVAVLAVTAVFVAVVVLEGVKSQQPYDPAKQQAKQSNDSVVLANPDEVEKKLGVTHVRITGKINNSEAYSYVDLSVTGPDRLSDEMRDIDLDKVFDEFKYAGYGASEVPIYAYSTTITVLLDEDGVFDKMLRIDGHTRTGTYDVAARYNNTFIGSTSFTVK